MITAARNNGTVKACKGETAGTFLSNYVKEALSLLCYLKNV